MTEHLQINDVSPRVAYVADGVQAAFTFPFAVFKAEDLQVWVDGILRTSGVSLSGIGISTGGVALFTVPPVAGSRVILRRRMALERTSDFQADGIIRAKTLNDELDYQVAAVQQVADDVSRCIQRPFTSASMADLCLPDPVAGKAIGWNADGTALVNDPADFAATLAVVTAQAGVAESACTAAQAAAGASAADRDAVSADRSAVAADLAVAIAQRNAADASARAAAMSETDASASRIAAASAASAAAASEIAASVSRDTAAASAASAAASEALAADSRNAAAMSEVGARAHMTAAAASADAAQTYAGQAQAAANVQTFSTIAVPGHSSIAARSAGDTLVVAAGANIALNTDAAADTLTIAVSGLAAVATSGRYADLQGLPGLGTAAAATLGTGTGQVPTADQVPALMSVATQTLQEAAASTAAAVTPGTQKFHPLSAKAWVKAGSTGTIAASVGVSSVSRTGTGTYTVTWSAAFSSANYAYLGTAAGCFLRKTGQTTTTLSVEIVNGGGTTVDAEFCLVAYGDLP